MNIENESAVALSAQLTNCNRRLKAIKAICELERQSPEEKINDVLDILNLPYPPTNSLPVLAKVLVGPDRQIEYHILKYNSQTGQYVWNTLDPDEITLGIGSDRTVVAWKYLEEIEL
jgi:hypothetical protein